jgi:hypothetical protein
MDQDKSPNPIRRFLRPLALFAIVCAAATTAPAAETWHDIQFAGFASQGALINTGNNEYLGNTSDGTFDFREYAANASWSKGKFRVGAQVFGQKLGAYGEDKMKIDWAVVDYQPAQWLGFRVGRVKMPRGLYNEALDLDSLRPFVLLPQSVYDARLRDFNAAFNGAMVYGNVSLHRLGTVDYKAFYGSIPMSVTSGASDYLNTGFFAENLAIGMDHTLGGTVFWNTPVSGLRGGYSYSEFDKLASTRRAVSGANIYTYTKTADPYKRHLVSLEYTHGDWIFAAEAGRETAEFTVIGFGPTTLIRTAKIDYAYVSASRRINAWLELGTYLSYSQDRQATNPLLRQADYALSAKFDLNEHTVFKLEVHQMNGAGKIFDTAALPQPLATRDDSWTMLAAKISFSF